MISDRRIRLAMIWAVALLLLALPVLAATITVDGNPADWGVIPAEATDANEAGVPDGNDLSAFYFTHDATSMYFRLDTYTAVDYGGSQNVYICMNTDNNVGTGGSFSQCDGSAGTSMNGVDYLIFASPIFGPFSYELRQCGSGATAWFSCPVVSGATVSDAWSSTTTELGVLFSDVGITPGLCTTASPCPIPMAAYFDNGDTAPDDNVPDTGLITPDVNCDGICAPSAIALGEFGQAHMAFPGWIIAASLFLGLGTMIFLRHPRH